jgi:hypothetical protein
MVNTKKVFNLMQEGKGRMFCDASYLWASERRLMHIPRSTEIPRRRSTWISREGVVQMLRTKYQNSIKT